MFYRIFTLSSPNRRYARFFSPKIIKTFFKKLSNIEKNISLQAFSIFSPIATIVFNIFDFPTFCTASYRLSLAFMAPRVLPMSNHAFTAPTALTRVYTTPLRPLEL